MDGQCVDAASISPPGAVPAPLCGTVLATLPNGSVLSSRRSGANWLAQVSHRDGSVYSDPFVLNTVPLSGASCVAAAALYGRSVAVAWTDEGPAAQRPALFLRVVDLFGQELGAERAFQIANGFAGCAPALRVLASDRFAMTWAGCDRHGDGRIQVCVFDATGKPRSAPQPVGGGPLHPPCELLLTAMPSAGFVVAWRSSSASEQAGFITQMFDDSCACIGDSFVCRVRD